MRDIAWTEAPRDSRSVRRVDQSGTLLPQGGFWKTSRECSRSATRLESKMTPVAVRSAMAARLGHL